MFAYGYRTNFFHTYSPSIHSKPGVYIGLLVFSVCLSVCLSVKTFFFPSNFFCVTTAPRILKFGTNVVLWKRDLLLLNLSFICPIITIFPIEHFSVTTALRILKLVQRFSKTCYVAGKRTGLLLSIRLFTCPFFFPIKFSSEISQLLQKPGSSKII